ncbi:Peptidase A1 domain-containing protein [Aphelenchoides besseyi]|nr:Peptidase A1 domain-containing protein [Aphelenchoides besseyi]
MLISGLLIATTLVTSVDAGSWSLAIREVKHVSRNKTLGPLNDIYTEVLNFDRSYYRATVYVGTPPKPFQVMIDTGCIAKGQQTTGNCESGKYVYDPKESVTAENLDTPLSISYGDGNVNVDPNSISWPSHHGKILRVEKGLILLTSLCISPPFVVFPVSLRGSSKVGNGFVGAKTLMCEKNIKENEG